MAPGVRPMGMQGSGADYSSFMGGHPEAFDYERAMEQRFGAASQVTIIEVDGDTFKSHVST